jgi:hypothetical protein
MLKLHVKLGLNQSINVAATQVLSDMKRILTPGL